MSLSGSLCLATLTILCQSLLTASMEAQQARLLKNINLAPLPPNSSKPTSFVTVGTRTVFAAEVSPANATLYISDGTTAGTQLIGGPTKSYFGEPTSLGNRALFVTNYGATPVLMASDGTQQGTVQLAPFSLLTYPNELLRFGNQVVFRADIAGAGTELCISDGTAGGTGLLMDIVPGVGSSYPGGFCVSANALYFCATDVSGAVEFWTSDGTTAGTRRLLTLTGPVSRYYQVLTMGTRFVIGTGGTVFLTDGTTAGTTQIGYGYPLGVAGGLAYYVNWPTWGGSDVDLYTNDGKGGPSTLVTKFLRVNGVGSSVTYAGLLYLNLNRGNGSADLTRTDGTQAGTFTLSASTSAPVVFQGQVYFAGDVGGQGFELCVTDGTLAGTRQLVDINPGPADSSPGHFAVSGNRLWFAANSSVGVEPWSTDGTVSGTKLIADLYLGPFGNLGSYPEFESAYGNAFFFASGQLWKSDGTSTGTTAISSVGRPDIAYVIQEREALGKLFYVDSKQLWATDGTSSGSRALANIDVGSFSSGSHHTVEFNGALLFAGNDNHGQELWKTDGSVTGTSMLKDLVPGPVGSNPCGFHQLGDEMIFFTIHRETSGLLPFFESQLWKTDGTAAGTQQIVVPGLKGHGIYGPTMPFKQGQFLFTTYTGHPFIASDRQLWISDGTAAGTQPAVKFNGNLVLLGSTSRGAFVYDSGSLSVWFTEGTPQTTVQLMTAPYTIIFEDVTGHMLGDELVFKSHTPTTGFEPFISDGTVAGTRLLADLVPGTGSSSPGTFVQVGHRYLYFIAGGNATTNLWRTDGTTTVPLSGNALGFPPLHRSMGRALMVADGKLYFAGDHPAVGVEPFVLDLDAAASEIGRGCGENDLSVLHATDPVIGTTDLLRLSGAVPSRAGLILFGARPRGLPSLMRLSAECLVMITAPIVSVPIQTDAIGRASFALQIPNSPALLGANVMAQAVVGQTKGSLGFDLSSGLHLFVGK